MFILFLISTLISIILVNLNAQTPAKKSIRLAIAGTTHGHTSFILGRKDKSDFKLVGVFETNTELAKTLAKKFGFDPKLIHNNLEKMLDIVKPEAVVAFGSIFEHMPVVEACAPRGIHVMVEKPLATNIEHAQRMAELAEKYHIHLLTNYETSWYPTTAKSFQLVNDSNFIGNIKKAVIHDGHQGPKEIGCDKVFLDWLTDPVQNGGGALVDFGCYGANLMTYIQKGQAPVSVTAVTRNFKPEIYSKVDDEATIIEMTKYDPYSLENNILVVKILDAARESARTGKTVGFDK